MACRPGGDAESAADNSAVAVVTGHEETGGVPGQSRSPVPGRERRLETERGQALASGVNQPAFLHEALIVPVPTLWVGVPTPAGSAVPRIIRR